MKKETHYSAAAGIEANAETPNPKVVVEEYRSAVCAQIRDPSAWVAQVYNCIGSSVRTLGLWVGSTVTLSCAVGLLALFWVSSETFSLAELQQGMRPVIQFIAVIMGAGCLLLNLGQFRNVFSERAYDTLRRKEKAKMASAQQTEIIESVLAKHGLITPPAAAKANS